MPANFKDLTPWVIDSWPPINYVDPVRRTWMPAYCLVWQLSSTAIIGGRLFLRARKEAGALGVDDALITVGWLFSIGFTATAWIGAEVFQEDRHTWDIPRRLWVGMALNAWVSQILFVVSTVLTKLSVLLLFRRLVNDAMQHRWLRIIYSVVFLTAAGAVAIIITYCFICQPLDAYWLSYNPNYTRTYSCVNGNALVICSCVLSSMSNLYTVLIPLAIVGHYQPDVSRGQRISLNVMFGLGILVIGTGIGRTYYFWQMNHTYDTAWMGFNLSAWAMAEVHLTIICACAPSLRIFFLLYMRVPVRRKLIRVRSQASRRRARDSDNTVSDLKSSEMDLRESSVVSSSKTMMYPEISPVEPALASPTSSRGDDVNKPVDAEKRVTTAEQYELYALAHLRAVSPKSMYLD